MISFDLFSKSLHERRLNWAKKNRQNAMVLLFINFNLTKKILQKNRQNTTGFALFGHSQLQFDEKNLAEKKICFSFFGAKIVIILISERSVVIITNPLFSVIFKRLQTFLFLHL